MPELDYAALAKMDTLIIMMGRAALEDVTTSLIAAGREPTTPAACIEWATTPRQRVVRAELGTIADEVHRVGLTAPIVTVIGRVAAGRGVDTWAASMVENRAE